MKALLKSLVIGAFAFVVSPANADPIGGSQPCGSCFGSEITLEYTANSATNYTITLTIDTSSYTGLATDYIYAVSIKPGTDLTGSLLSENTPDSWTFMLGGLNNAGCNGSGNGFLCADTAGTSTITDGSTYSWVFDVTIDDPNKWALAALGSHVKVNYDGEKCDNGCLTSEDITLQEGGGPPNEVPEPQTLALVGLGLIALAYARRRRTH